MTLTEFGHAYKSVIVSPTKAFKQIDGNSNKMLLGFVAALIPAILYTLFYIMASAAGGAPSAFVPWLNLPMDRYFFFAIFLTIPGYLLAFFFATGFVYFCLRLSRTEVSFESVLMVLGFGVGVGSLSSLIHDLTDSFLGFIGVIDIKQYEMMLNQPTFWRYLLLTLYTIYSIWVFILFQKGFKVVANIGNGKSTVFALISLVAFQLVLLITIR